MLKWDTGGVRHVLMRAGLAFVMTWFGIQELRNPSEWAVFVPSVIADHSPVALNDLILLHGFLLLLAAGSVGLGLLYLPGCLLAMGLLTDILFGLWLDNGINDLVIRDVGLLAMAGGLALDPVRFWHLESVLPRVLSPPPRATRRRAAKDGKASLTAGPAGPVWLVQASGAAGLVAVVLGLAFLLQATGSSGDGLPDGAALSLSGSTNPSPAPSAAAAAKATPAASSIRFADWQYRQYAFQIYPGDVSSDAKKALSGYQFSVQDQGNKAVLLLKALSSNYKDYQVSVDKGNTAYFVETSMRDDPTNQENNLRDDLVIVVNPEGYILQP